MYQDRSLTCRDCAEEFSFSAGEQAFFASKGLTNDPQRCPICRAVAKRARSDRGTTRVPRRDLRGLRGSGRRPVRATERSTRLLQFLLRQGQGRDPGRRVGDRLAARPRSNLLSSHEAGPETGRPRVIMAGRQHQEEAAVGVIIIREMVGTSPQSWSDAARQAVATASKTVRNIQTVEVVKSTRGRRGRRDRRVPRRGQDRLRIRGLSPAAHRRSVAANRAVSAARHDGAHARTRTHR